MWGKIFFVILFLCFVSNVQASTERSVILDQAIRIGQDAAKQAFERTKRQIFLEVMWRFQEVNIYLPPPNDFKACRENPRVVAYRERYTNRISICSYAFSRQPANETPYILGQVLIHEVIHSLGVNSECATTKIERDILRNSDYEIYIWSRYDECDYD